jgi:serralysin
LQKTLLWMFIGVVLLALMALLPSSIGADDPASGSFEQQVIELTNQERQANGLAPLRPNENLAKAAAGHSQAMASEGFFAHQNPKDNSDVGVRARRVAYNWNYIGENIALGSPTPQRVVAGWMNSPGHRANILNPEFREIGIGYVATGRDADACRPSLCRHYWTQVFGRRPDDSSAGNPVARSTASVLPTLTAARNPDATPTQPRPPATTKPTGLLTPWEAPLQILRTLCGCWCLVPLVGGGIIGVALLLRQRRRF